MWVMLHIFNKIISQLFFAYLANKKIDFCLSRTLRATAADFLVVYDLSQWKDFAHMHCAYFSMLYEKVKKPWWMCLQIGIIAFLHNSNARAKIEMRINCGQCVWTFSTLSAQFHSYERLLRVASTKYANCVWFMIAWIGSESNNHKFRVNMGSFLSSLIFNDFNLINFYIRILKI